MRPKVKYAVIYRHRNEYSVSVMCKFFEVSRSGCYDFVRRIGQTESDAELAKKIQECQDRTDKTYGYRRVWKWLKDRNIEKNPKTVLRVMKKYGLLSEIRRRRKWVNLGQQIHKYKNLLNRQFQTDRQAEYEMGHGHLLRPYKGGCIVSVHDPAGDEEREKESRCGVAAPQRPGLSIYLSWIF